MSSFETLDLAPELVEALASEGIETPTRLQEQLIPVVRRGNDVVALAGPGSGILAAYAAPLLERIPPEEGAGPQLLILSATPERAAALAESLGRLALVTGHRVAALDPLWVLPGRAHVVLATPEEAVTRLKAGQLSLESVQALVLDDAGGMAASGSIAAAATLSEGLGPQVQRVVISLPPTEEVEAFARTHLRKAVHVPPRAADGSEVVPSRGEITALEFDGTREMAALQAVANLLLEARHVAAFVRSEDAAADLGDFLGLRGYRAGRPGDPEVPVWLAASSLEGRTALDESGAQEVAVLSVDVPGDADALDRRHGSGRGGTVLTLPRELSHLKAVAREAGYSVAMRVLSAPEVRPSGLARLLGQLDEAAGQEDVEAYRALLAPVFEKHGAATVAAAAVALLRQRTAAAPSAAEAPPSPDRVQSFVRLFISVGKRDNVGPGDLVGAIAGEADVDAGRIGRIELKDSFSLVEVEQAVADRVIRALNGVSIRGRAARVDYHREERSAGGRGGRPRREERGGGGG
ncbi:MAG: DEAD/DEAH box helicase, partial [Gemmatimonadota bacterium]